MQLTAVNLRNRAIVPVTWVFTGLVIQESIRMLKWVRKYMFGKFQLLMMVVSKRIIKNDRERFSFLFCS